MDARAFAPLFAAPEVPPAALERLREADPALNMRFIASAAGPYWAITRDWAPGDPRWEAVQLQHIDPKSAHDIVATLPGDCSPAEAGAFVERHFKKSADPKKDAIKAVEESVKRDMEAQDANLKRFIQDQHEKATHTSDHERRMLAGAEGAHPMIDGADLAPEAPKAPEQESPTAEE